MKKKEEKKWNHWKILSVSLLLQIKLPTICRGDYVYPGWANGIGWLIAMTAILSVPLMAIVTVIAAYRKRPEEGLLAAFNRYSDFQHSFLFLKYT